jgi:hypothetical protein
MWLGLCPFEAMPDDTMSNGVPMVDLWTYWPVEVASLRRLDDPTQSPMACALSRVDVAKLAVDPQFPFMHGAPRAIGELIEPAGPP